CPEMWRDAMRFPVPRLMLLCGLVAALFLTRTPAQEKDKDKEKPAPKLTAKAIAALAKSFAAERKDAAKDSITKRVSPELLDRADALAKQGAAALKAGRLIEARDLYRQARFGLPSISAGLPANVG